MADKTIIETFYSSTSKYEVVKNSSVFSTDFIVRKNGKYLASYGSLRSAVETARSLAKK